MVLMLVLVRVVCLVVLLRRGEHHEIPIAEISNCGGRSVVHAPTDDGVENFSVREAFVRAHLLRRGSRRLSSS